MTADKGSGMLRFFVDRRCIKILQILSERQDYISIGQLADLLEQTRRQTQYDIYKINMIFDTVGLPPCLLYTSHHDRAYDVQGHKMFFLMRLGKLDHDGGMQLFGCGDDSQNVFEPGGVETADSSSSGISLF